MRMKKFDSSKLKKPKIVEFPVVFIYRDFWEIYTDTETAYKYVKMIYKRLHNMQRKGMIEDER